MPALSDQSVTDEVRFNIRAVGCAQKDDFDCTVVSCNSIERNHGKNYYLLDESARIAQSNQSSTM